MHVSEYHKIAAFQAKHWWFFGRKQFLHRFLATSVPGRNAETLDLGCGTGQAILFLQRLGFRCVRGIDNSPMAIEFCRKNGLTAVELGRAEELPYGDQTFDAVLCLDVFEHVADDGALLAQIWRVLKPGGHVFITVPAFHSLWSRHDEVLEHHRRYEFKDLAVLIRQRSWIVKEHSYFFFFIFPLVVAYRWFKRFDRRPRTSDLDLIPEPLNAILKGLSLLEVAMVRLIGRLPFGTSLYLTLKKPNS